MKMQTQEEIRKQYNIPRHIRNILRASHDAVIEDGVSGPALLKRKQRADMNGYDWDFAGDVCEEDGEYVVLLTAPYDPETGSDMEAIDRYAGKEAAIDKLWELRH